MKQRGVAQFGSALDWGKRNYYQSRKTLINQGFLTD